MRGHDLGVDARRRSSSCTASRRPARAGGGRSQALARTLSRARARTSRATARPRAGRPSFDACAAYVRALAPAPLHARAATRWAAGSRCTPRSRIPSASSGSCSSARARASPTPASARRAGAADDALADRIEAIGVEAFAREWGAQPLFAGQPAAVARRRARRPAAQHAGRPRRRAARPRTGVMPPLWDRLRRARRCRSTLIVGERDEKFRAIAERMAARAARDARLVVVPGAGHAAQLEAPDAVAAAIGSRDRQRSLRRLTQPCCDARARAAGHG